MQLGAMGKEMGKCQSLCESLQKENGQLRRVNSSQTSHITELDILSTSIFKEVAANFVKEL